MDWKCCIILFLWSHIQPPNSQFTFIFILYSLMFPRHPARLNWGTAGWVPTWVTSSWSTCARPCTRCCRTVWRPMCWTWSSDSGAVSPGVWWRRPHNWVRTALHIFLVFWQTGMTAVCLQEIGDILVMVTYLCVCVHQARPHVFSTACSQKWASTQSSQATAWDSTHLSSACLSKSFSLIPVYTVTVMNIFFSMMALILDGSLKWL